MRENVQIFNVLGIRSVINGSVRFCDVEREGLFVHDLCDDYCHDNDNDNDDYIIHVISQIYMMKYSRGYIRQISKHHHFFLLALLALVTAVCNSTCAFVTSS